MRSRIHAVTVLVLGLVVLALVAGAGQAAAGQQPRGTDARQIGWAARPEPVPEPCPSAPPPSAPPSAPAGDRRGNAVVTDIALLLALGFRPRSCCGGLKPPSTPKSTNRARKPATPTTASGTC